MYKNDFHTWQDLRDLDQPGACRTECKLLLKQIFGFTCSETATYEEASEEDVKKQDVSYRLLEEENIVLKSELLSFQKIIKLKEDEIATLKANTFLHHYKRQEETCIEFEEVPLPDVECTGRISNIVHKNVLEQINNNIPFVKIQNWRKLEDRIKTLTDEITVLKSSLMSCHLELIEYDKILTGIKQECYNLNAELKETKELNSALKSRNEFLEEKVISLENLIKEPSPTDENGRYEEDELIKKKILNCYENRLYEALKEMSAKEEQIGQLSGLIEKFKVEYSDRLKGSEHRQKDLQEEKVKTEETIRQQSKLIHLLQDLVEAKERKYTSKMNCL